MAWWEHNEKLKRIFCESAFHTLNLESDGTVKVVRGIFLSDNVLGWKDVVAVAAGIRSTVGLKSDNIMVVT